MKRNIAEGRKKVRKSKKKSKMCKRENNTNKKCFRVKKTASQLLIRSLNIDTTKKQRIDRDFIRVLTHERDF